MSLLHVMNDGTSLAIAAIRYEGKLGLPIFFDEKGPAAKAIMHIAGQAYCRLREIHLLDLLAQLVEHLAAPIGDEPHRAQELSLIGIEWRREQTVLKLS